MLTNEEIIEVFKKTNVMKHGHFLLTSGRHSDTYMQCARLFENPKYSELLCHELAEKLRDEKIDLVIGLAIGGIIMAYEMSRQLNVPNVFAERQNGEMTLRRGFKIEPHTKVLVIEDVVTTGGSVKEVLELLKKYDADVVGVCSMVDRSNGKVDFGYPYKNLLSMEILSYEKDECPFCKDNIPVVKPGSRNIQ